MTKVNKQDAMSLVASLQEGSSTNLCGGLLKGMCVVLISQVQCIYHAYETNKLVIVQDTKTLKM